MARTARGDGGLTARDRYWLRHVTACERSGDRATEYAKRHGLSIGAYYEAKRRLVGRGALPGKATTRATPVFTQVVTAERPERGGFRVRLPGGALLEWEHAPATAEIGDLVGKLER